MYAEHRSPAIWISVLVSAVLHISALFLGGRGQSNLSNGGDDMFEVNVLERYDITQRPQVAKVVPRPEPGGGSGNELTETSVTGYAPQHEENVPTIDLSAALERGPTQAKIDLDRYELDRSGTSMDIVYLGGRGSSQSTEEILSRPPIDLSQRGGSGPTRASRGIPGIPQAQAQITIEHRALVKPSTPSLPQVAPEPVPTISSPTAAGTSFQIAGPISQREITKKVKPRYPRWALQQRICGTVKVRIWVLPSGRVKGMPQVMSSSGYPDLDQVVVEALKLWEFAPLGPDVRAEEQWGDVTFVFQLS